MQTLYGMYWALFTSSVLYVETATWSQLSGGDLAAATVSCKLAAHAVTTWAHVSIRAEPWHNGLVLGFARLG
jgi:hypothetical protein